MPAARRIPTAPAVPPPRHQPVPRAAPGAGPDLLLKCQVCFENIQVHLAPIKPRWDVSSPLPRPRSPPRGHKAASDGDPPAKGHTYVRAGQRKWENNFTPRSRGAQPRFLPQMPLRREQGRTPAKRPGEMGAGGCWPRWGAQPPTPPAPASPALARVSPAPQPRALPGRGHCPAKAQPWLIPDPFPITREKNPPCKAAVGWSRQGGRGGGGFHPVLSSLLESKRFFSHQLSFVLPPNSRQITCPVAGCSARLSAGCRGWGAAGGVGGAKGLPAPGDDVSHLLFGSTKRESWWRPAPPGLQPSPVGGGHRGRC